MSHVTKSLVDIVLSVRHHSGHPGWLCIMVNSGATKPWFNHDLVLDEEASAKFFRDLKYHLRRTRFLKRKQKRAGAP